MYNTLVNYYNKNNHLTTLKNKCSISVHKCHLLHAYAQDNKLSYWEGWCRGNALDLYLKGAWFESQLDTECTH
jgi:hypothetical protein